MRAVVFDGRSARFEARYAEPEVPAGEALVRPLLAGVCSTDLEICRGYMGFEGVLGHEFVGVVEELGPEAGEEARSLVGRRVVGSINCVCGVCDMCRRGLSNHCRDRTVLGIQGRDGCFADRFVLPVANLLAVPEGVDDDHAVFTEPVAAACQVLQQLHVEGTPYVTVLGDGRLGLLVAQVMSKLNATVRVVGRHPEKLALCEKWGVKHRPVDEVIARADQDVVVDCTGSASGLETAIGMVRPRGTIVLKSTVANQSGVDLAPLVVNEVEVIGSRCGPFPEALRLLRGGEVDVLSLISRRYKVEEAEAAMKAAQEPDVIKVLLEFN